MKPFKFIRLIWTFYQSFIIATIAITACCLSLFWKYGFSIYMTIFWFKIATLAITFYFINSFKSREYYYYQNLGISKRMLWISTMGFDFAIFIFLIIQIHKFR